MQQQKWYDDKRHPSHAHTEKTHIKYCPNDRKWHQWIKYTFKNKTFFIWLPFV